MSLFTFGINGCLANVNRAVYEERKQTVASLKNFDNSNLKTSTQFLEGANKDELLRSVDNVHSPLFAAELRKKLEVIELSVPAQEGVFIIILDSENKDCYKSKSIVILHVSTAKSTGVKIYDCFIHSVCFELVVSTLKVLLFSIATVAVTAVVVTTVGSKHSGLLAAGMLGTGAVFSALNVRPHMPDFAEDALNLLMVESLTAKGMLIEIGTEYVLKTSLNKTARLQ